MSQDRLQDIHFAKGGVDVSRAFTRQSARPGPNGEPAIYTSPAAYNVRPFSFDGRFRGGSRPALRRYIPTAAEPGNIVQHLNVLPGTFDDPSGAEVQPSNSGRVVLLVKVARGNVYVASPGDTAWTSTTNNTGNSPPLNITGLMFSAANNQKLYFADGVNKVYYKASDNTVNTWTPSAGTLPGSAGIRPRLICTWRGRTVQARLEGEEQNWFMSRTSDPDDWDYFTGVEDDPLQAVKGNNSDLGLIGDIVNGLVPYNDDILYFLNDHSIEQMTGDPLNGGQRDNISDGVGAAFGQAWCRGPEGAIYFFSNTCSIFALTRPNAPPVRISGPIDPLLKDINTGEYTVSMCWDDRDIGFHVFVTKTEAAAEATHFWYDARAAGWYPDRFRNKNHNPLVCCTMDGNGANDRVALIGSWDGYVRSFDWDATKDDGYLVDSSIWLGPILTPSGDEIMLKTLQATLDSNSDPVNCDVYSGRTPQEALESTTPKSITFGSGRNLTQLVKRSGHAHYLNLTSTGQWAMEYIKAAFPGRAFSKTRGRGK